MKRLNHFFVAFLLTPLTYAKAAPPKLWTADITAGYTLSRGNTENDMLSSTAKVNRKTQRNETTFEGGGAYSSSKGTMDGQNYRGSARYAYSFGKRMNWYHFYKQEGEHDKFALIAIRAVTSTGVGYWWSDTANFKMMAELGVGYEHTEYGADRDTTNQGVAIPRFYIEKKILDNSKISEDFSMFLGSQERVNGHRYKSETKFSTPLSTHLSLEISLLKKYSSKPPAGAKKEDLQMINSLKYKF